MEPRRCDKNKWSACIEPACGWAPGQLGSTFLMAAYQMFAMYAYPVSFG